MNGVTGVIFLVTTITLVIRYCQLEFNYRKNTFTKNISVIPGAAVPLYTRH